MPTKQIDEKHMEPEKQEPLQRTNAIAGHLLHILGKPGDLHSVQVRHLWGDHFRVNVLVGADASSIKVAQSFFLVAASDGNIVSSTPIIKRLYQLVAERAGPSIL
jgi:hypothetical protein